MHANVLTLVLVRACVPACVRQWQGVGQTIEADPVSGDLFVLGRTKEVLPNSTAHNLVRLYAATNFTTSHKIATLQGIDVLGE